MQRLALARAIVVEPELLLLDEPTANLDPKSSAKIEELISNLTMQEITVIMATHNMGQCQRLADKVAVLKQGNVIEVVRPEEIFDGSGDLFNISQEDHSIKSESAPW